MFFKQFYDTSLAQASYMIGCQQTGEAIVIDPARDVDAYIRTAAQEGFRIINVTETHIHADFVSGSRELSSLTGARILLSAEGGEDWQYTYAAADNALLLHDGDVFMVGNIKFDVVHTPGHTPEHLSFVVSDTPAAAGAMGILTGDFVFVGDVGRPDLLEKAAKIAGTMESSARTLFASLQRFRALPDHLQVWPGHGAGSACGKALGAVPSSTVGYEKLANWALNISNEQTFVDSVLDGQPDPPTYFARMKHVNKEGPRVLRGIQTPAKLPASAIHSLADKRALVIDTRASSSFAQGHVPRTLNIPYTKSFSTWAGWLLDPNVDIALIVNADEHDLSPTVLSRAVRDLAAVGFDRVTGWLDQHALQAWTDAGQSLATVPQISVVELADELRVQGAPSSLAETMVIDVRNDDEWSHGHIIGAQHIALGHLPTGFSASPDTLMVVHCQSGARSSIAASLLMREGYTNVRNLTGGFTAWEENKQPVKHE
ncbi:MAG: MBL fold metallo-hydrolase [Gemmatimonadaceae bacterium]